MWRMWRMRRIGERGGSGELDFQRRPGVDAPVTPD
jgi:hypothetical protein